MTGHRLITVNLLWVRDGDLDGEHVQGIVLQVVRTFVQHIHGDFYSKLHHLHFIHTFFSTALFKS